MSVLTSRKDSGNDGRVLGRLQPAGSFSEHFVVQPLDKSARGKPTEDKNQNRLSAPDNQAEKEQYPHKMCKGFFALYILIQ
ncbi:unnamed protein product, partial [marine sediment metagenome]